MDESIDLIGGLLGHVYKYGPLNHVQMLNMSKNIYSWNTCIGQIRKLAKQAKKNFGKPKLCF